MGPFITAYLKVNGDTAAARQQAAAWLARVHTHLLGAGVGQVSEVFEGDAPYHPRGCIVQAWSAAELLRTSMEGVLGRPPTPSQ